MSDFVKLRKQMTAQRRAREAQMGRENREAISPIQGTISAFKTAGGNIKEDFLDGLKKYESSQEELYRPKDSISGYAEDIGYGTLNELSGLLQMGASPFSGALRTVLPMETLGNVISAVTPQAVKDTAAEYPRQTEALFNVAELALPRSATDMFKKGLTNVALNTPTKVPGFYGPVGPIGKGIAAAKVALPNVGKAINLTYNPFEIAKTRQAGTGQARRQEYVTRALEGDANQTRGTSLASGFIDTQRQNKTERPDSVFGQSREMQKYVKDFFDISDTDRVKQNLTSSFDVPPVIVDRAVRHLKAIHGISDAPGKTTLVVRRRDSGEGLQGEARGVATTSSPILKYLRGSGGIYDQMAKVFPDLSTQERLAKLLSIANASDRNAMLKAAGQVLSVSTIKDKKGNFKGGSALTAQYLRAKKKEKSQLTAQDKELIKYFDSARTPKVNEVEPGVFAMSASHRSTAQDLGGMNDFITVDTNKGKVYSMTSDGHDMFGMDPPGGNSLVNVLPIEVFDIGSTETIDATVKKQKADFSAIERLTGVPVKRGPRGGMLETENQYQARAVRDMKAQVNRGDVAEAVSNLAKTGMFGAAMLPPEQEEGR